MAVVPSQRGPGRARSFCADLQHRVTIADTACGGWLTARRRCFGMTHLRGMKHPRIVIIKKPKPQKAVMPVKLSPVVVHCPSRKGQNAFKVFQQIMGRR